MPVSAVKATSSARNGVGAFILQCKRLDFHYCDWAGSSKGMNLFLSSPLLSDFASRSPSITMHISPRPHHHPVVRAHYVNAPPKSICVRNLSKEQILEKAMLLRDASGAKNRRVTGGKVVKSFNDSVRGVWSGIHAAGVAGKESNRWNWDETEVA